MYISNICIESCNIYIYSIDIEYIYIYTYSRHKLSYTIYSYIIWLCCQYSSGMTIPGRLGPGRPIFGGGGPRPAAGSSDVIGCHRMFVGVPRLSHIYPNILTVSQDLQSFLGLDCMIKYLYIHARHCLTGLL